jgi:hypothetical protein
MSFIQVAFIDAQDAKMSSHDIATLKHRFMDFTKVVYQDAQDADNEFSGRFVYLNITKATSCKSLFQCPGFRKWVPMDSRHLETSHHRIHQSRFLIRLKEKLCF